MLNYLSASFGPQHYWLFLVLFLCWFLCVIFFFRFYPHGKKVNVSADHCWTLICVSPAETLWLLSDLGSSRGC